MTRYEDDFYTWAMEQAGLMRSGKLDGVDLGNIAEELETLGRSEAAALESALRLIAMHQLKRMFQPERSDSRSWTTTINRERINLARLLRQNPGLQSRLNEAFKAAYADARKEASIETGLVRATFPHNPPFTLEQIRDEAH